MGGLLLAFLEMTFVMVAILLLHSLKRSIGSPAFYLSLGLFFVLGQIVSSTGLMVDPARTGLQVPLGKVALLAPFMVSILIVYIVDGTLEAQRMIMGLLAILFGYFYLANITVSQTAWSNYVAVNPEAINYLESLFLEVRRVMVASFLAFAADLFVLPVVFQIFHNRRCRLFFSVLATLVLAQAVDSFIFHLVATPKMADWWASLRMTYLASAFSMVWLSILATVYLHMCNVQQQGSRRPLDIVVAFFGGYGRVQELQRDLQEWEGRYSIVIQNTSDMIFILSQEGRVLNANNAALQGLGHLETATGFYLPGIVREVDGKPCNWSEVWEKLSGSENAAKDDSGIVHQEWELSSSEDRTLFLDVNFSKAQLHEEPVAVVIGRDVTERRMLSLEREKLQEQLMQAQRMEAVGQLAGGVAHDFNNLLHTIQGSVDRLTKKEKKEEMHQSLLSNISEACSRASGLISQLLGFARKGKYQIERLDIVNVMKKTKALFEPVAPDHIELKMIVAPNPLYVNGDSGQLQQVFLNLLINARDAILEDDEGQKSGKIVFRAEDAAEFTPGWDKRPVPDAKPEQYICVRVKDNGVGIPADIMGQIFDPFFTTKGVGKGTGMGLAMAYGCVGNHNGWIHTESIPGKGTEFFIFFPRA